MEAILKLLGWLAAVTPRVAVTLLLLSILLLLAITYTPILPSELVRQRGWIWVALFASGALSVTYGAQWLHKLVLAVLLSHSRQRKWLKHLTPEERRLLAFYIQREMRTRHLNLGSGVAGGLMSTGIVFAGSNVSIGGTLAFNISKYAYEYLRKHPELIALSGPLDQKIGFD